MDLMYIENYSIFLDLRIVLMTLKTALFPGETNEELIAALVQKIRDLNDQLNIPQSIKDYANGGVKVDAENPQMVSEEEFLAKLPEIAANAEQDACTPENPRETKAADFEKILKACYYDTDIDF